MYPDEKNGEMMFAIHALLAIVVALTIALISVLSQ